MSLFVLYSEAAIEMTRADVEDSSKNQLQALEKLSSDAMGEVRKFFEQRGIVVRDLGWRVRYATKDVAIQVTPRKKHMRLGKEHWLCNTETISKKNIVDKPEEVTCRRCLAILNGAKPHPHDVALTGRVKRVMTDLSISNVGDLEFVSEQTLKEHRYSDFVIRELREQLAGMKVDLGARSDQVKT